LGTTRYTYNQALEYLNNNQCYPDHIQVRNKLVPKKNIPNDKKWILDTPKNIRAEAIRDLCKGFKSKNSNPKKFRCRKDFRQSFTISKHDLKENLNLYPKILGKNSALFVKEKVDYINRTKKRSITKIVNDEKIKKKFIKTFSEVEFDIKIVHEKTGKWYMCVSETTELLKSENQGQKIIALDPGVRTFLTYYCPNNEIGKIADNVTPNLINYLSKTDKLRSRMDKEKGIRKKKILTMAYYRRNEKLKKHN
jgi:putative transposase